MPLAAGAGVAAISATGEVIGIHGHAAMDTAKELWAGEVLRFLRAPS